MQNGTPDRLVQDAASELTPASSSVASRTSTTTDSKKKKIKKKSSTSSELQKAHAQIAHEKAGKRKLFHSLVKLANELRRTRAAHLPLLEQQQYVEQEWYTGGLWRAPRVLPFAKPQTANAPRQRQAISLSALFLHLIVVTALTRVGVVISSQGFVSVHALLYFAVFWQMWTKEASYTTRFDTTDLSAQLVTLEYQEFFARTHIPEDERSQYTR